MALLVALAFLLWAAAAVGLSYVAGFGAVGHRLSHATWEWFPAIAGGVLLGFAGYYLAYRGIERVEGGPRLDREHLRAAVTAGFGGFLARGGAVLDHFAMKAGGADDREADVRVTALGGFEHGVLGVIASCTAIALLIGGFSHPPDDITLSWAIVPTLGFALAFWAAERYRERLRDGRGWRARTGIFLDAVHLTRELFAHPRRSRWTLVGMGLFWAGDMVAIWCGMAAFGFHMGAGPLVVAVATGMIVTRRTAPLGGAGVLTLALAPTLWYSGAPWAPAVLGVAAYRFVSLFLPMPASFAQLPRLREIAPRDRQSGEPALRP